MNYQEVIGGVILHMGWIIEYIGLGFIAAAVFVSLVKLPMKNYTMQHIRVHLAKKIIFGLEFVIAADILLATVAQNLDDIIQLGSIVLIRVILGYSLRKEIVHP